MLKVMGINRQLAYVIVEDIALILLLHLSQFRTQSDHRVSDIFHDNFCSFLLRISAEVKTI